MQLIHVSIDPSRLENRPENLKPELEENEFIETFAIPLKDMFTEFRKLEAEGYAIDARVGTIAEGMRMVSMWGITS